MAKLTSYNSKNSTAAAGRAGELRGKARWEFPVEVSNIHPFNSLIFLFLLSHYDMLMRHSPEVSTELCPGIY